MKNSARVDDTADISHIRLAYAPSPRDYLKCMLVFKSLHGYLLKEFSQSRDFHSYNTCHRYQGSFRFSRAKIWNMLPLALRSEPDNKFAFGLNKHFRSEPN